MSRPSPFPINAPFRAGLLWLVCFGQALAADPRTPVQMVIDGKPVAAGGAEVRVPASFKSVSFRLGRPARDDPPGARRMRFKLEGVDHDWRQIDSEMCLAVRFVDAAGDQVGQRLFPVTGASTGWRGEVTNSTFTQRRETLRVPEGGALLTTALSSSGPPTAMGLYAVADLKIRRGPAAGGEVLFELAGLDADADTAPKGWGRSGTRPSMARTLRAASGGALSLIDDDPNAHAEWVQSRGEAPRVQPGETLTIEWSEMHDIGMGNLFDVNYGKLEAGAYRFWAQELDTIGTPLGTARALDFTVLEPVWRRGWFITAALALTLLILWLGSRAIISARIRKHLARVEQAHMLERERLRIARDLHDDLGARLTHISLVSGLAETDAQSASARENFQHISGMARELVAALSQTVWTVNPEHDHLDALINYIGQLTANLCEPAQIRRRIHSCEAPAGRTVSSEMRHNITLTVKEALHNAVKHSAATEITVTIQFRDPVLTVTVADNGRGFEASAESTGHGLQNMRRRVAAIGGTLTLQSSPTAGTSVTLEVAIPR